MTPPTQEKAEDGLISRRLGLGESSAGGGVLLLEELISSAKLPHDTRRGLFDPTHRGYVLHVRRDLKEVAVGKPRDECLVLAGAARFPAQVGFA